LEISGIGLGKRIRSIITMSTSTIKTAYGDMTLKTLGKKQMKKAKKGKCPLCNCNLTMTHISVFISIYGQCRGCNAVFMFDEITVADQLPQVNEIKGGGE